MAPPPAKRQKRLVLSSDDETSNITSSAPKGTDTVLRRPTRPAAAAKARKNEDGKPQVSPKSRRQAPTNSSTSSPDKKKAKGSSTETVKSKSLHSFFSKISEEERWHNKEQHTQDSVGRSDEDIEDIDDDSADDMLCRLAPSPERHFALDRRKDSILINERGPSTAKAAASVPSSSFSSTQKFTNPSFRGRAGSNVPSNTTFTSDHRPWADRFGPENLEELAVHKKKIDSVQAWLVDALSHQRRRHLLVLKGPAGSGKTATLVLLAKCMGVQVIEWRNSTASDGVVSASFVSHFDDFLNRAGTFGSLNTVISNSNTATAPPRKDDTPGRRVFMIDEFPTTFTRSAVALHAFRSSVIQFLSSGSSGTDTLFQRPKDNTEGAPPLVMIISETLLSSSTASADSFTAHRLLGPEISNHPDTHIIEFNPVAPMFIKKALDTVIRKEARSSRRRRVPGPTILKRLSEMGDIRSAINSMEFLCLRGDDTGDWGGTVASMAKRGSKEGSALTAMEKESLELITQRESTLGMFHAVGKVVYNKRDDPSISSTSIVKPPEHLLHLQRPKVSQVSVNELLNEIGTDISTYISSLHENYVLSCAGISFVECLNECIDYLSESDLLDTGSWRSIALYRAGVGSARATVQTSSMDLIRQSEITFDVAIRGLLFSLPSPVARATHPSGKKGDSHKMLFPAALRLWKKTEEIEGSVSIWRSRLERGDTPTTGSTAMKGEGVASWKRPHDLSNSFNENDNAPSRFIASRSDLLFDYLPYLQKIRQARSNTSTASPDLKLITQFDGIDTPNDNEEDHLDDLHEEIRNLLPDSPSKHPYVKILLDGKQDAGPLVNNNHLGGSGGGRAAAEVVVVGTEPQMEKLYISDDDIEDD